MKAVDFNRVGFIWVDLDDTIWDFEANSLDSLGMVYEAFKLKRYFTDADAWRERYLYHNHELWALYNVGDISRDYLQRERFFRPLTEAGCTVDEVTELVPLLHHYYLDVLGRHSALVPGARELLVAIREKGWRTGIISNGFKEVQYRKLESAGIGGLIDCVVLSDEIEVNKPDIRLFDFAVRKAGVTNRESLIIGDNPMTDIAGGDAAGWQTIYFNRDGRGAESPVDTFTVNSLTEIIKLF